MDGSPDAAVVFADDDDGATKDIVDVEVDEARAEEQEADATGRLTALLGLLLLTRPLPSFVLSATSSPFVVVAAAAAASVPAAVPAAAAAATDGEEKEEREGQVEKLAKEPNEEEEKEDEEKEDEAASASIEDDVVEALKLLKEHSILGQAVVSSFGSREDVAAIGVDLPGFNMGTGACGR
eukprot:CAMPEP_0206632248 /NCGR_PEP_ID=MMETSP0325_2-20121206/68782_1 /ASSEMBLY_ACC=CAM_ASM_000347 /TAXON_ID=2866 /ORGANISM="Crypthecodinium cohnii, Strain Seligo" /LENGTH=180 /DNA_ID=CAMNT_0054157715 /DNA_START=1270 /DNA_END=1813 /DNA_ORIENTATION=-